MKQEITSGRLRQRKKGTHTDYVARQYLGRLGKVDNGIVSVNIYGVLDGITFPLLFEIYKPKSTLKPDDVYQSKPQIAAKLVTELVELGFNIRYVLADSLYGEPSNCRTESIGEIKFTIHGVNSQQSWRVAGSYWEDQTAAFLFWGSPRIKKRQDKPNGVNSPEHSRPTHQKPDMFAR
jgi:SRSO17 transposase